MRRRRRRRRAGAAAATARAGRRTLVVDDQLHLGGSLRADPRCGRAAAEHAIAAAASAGAALLGRATAIGFFPEDGGPEHDGVLAVAAPDRLHRVYARAWIWATGGYAVNLPFPDNDRPGVMAARAVGRLLVDHGILAGDKVCVVEDPAMAADAAALADALAAAGADVQRVAHREVTAVRGRSWATAVDTARGRIDCDAVAVAAIPAPASEGARQQGCRVVLDPAGGGFRIVVDDAGRTSAPNVWACGDVTGYVGPARAAAEGARIGARVAAA